MLLRLENLKYDDVPTGVDPKKQSWNIINLFKLSWKILSYKVITLQK